MWNFTIMTAEGVEAFKLTPKGSVIFGGDTETEMDAKYLVLAFKAAADAIEAYLRSTGDTDKEE